MEGCEGGDAAVKTSTGDVSIADADVSSLSIETSSGKSDIRRVNASGAITLITDTGKVNVSELTAAESSFKVDTGDIAISGARLASLTVRADTGDTDLSDVIASGKFDIKADTGHVRFEGCDAAEVFIETDTGKVQGSFLSAKVIFAESNTGKIDVPKLTEGGRCEIKTDTGKIEITVR